MDLEIALVKAFGWSLHDIDETDVDSLMPFIRRLLKKQNPGGQKHKLYADQVTWL